MPYFLGNFVNANDRSTYPRRVYVDLGAKDFGSSICFTLMNYPAKFDRVWGFECQQDLSNLTAIADEVQSCLDEPPPERRQGYVLSEVLASTKILYNYVGLEDGEGEGAGPATVGFSR
jgi:hypothetical protein